MNFKYYKYYNKADTFLANLLRAKYQTNQIPRIRTPQATITYKPKGIRDIFYMKIIYTNTLAD